MIRLLKKLVLVLVVLSLPLQGLMAATMVFCPHESKLGQANSAQATAQHPEQHAHHEHGKSDNPGSTCHDCGSCQVCTSPALSAQLITTALTVAVFPQAQASPKIRLFFPDLFQRPPLALAA